MQSNSETGSVVESAAVADTRPYFPELDGLRAIAALMVMVFHFGPINYFPHIIIFGQTGVDLFFVLSGFLITTILLQSPHGDWSEVRKFYIRRSLRIFPLYYGSLFVLIAVGWAAPLWYWFYLQNFPLAFAQIYLGPTHYWSLAVEEQFYLVWPFLVLFWPRRRLAAAMWAAVAVAIALRMALVPTHFIWFVFTPTRLDGLAGGGLLALLYLRGSLGRAKGRMAGLLVFAIGLLAVQAATSHGNGLYWVEVTKFSASALLYACVIGLLITTKESPIHKFLRSSPMRGLGRVSYGLYVYHPFVFFMTKYAWVTRLHPLVQALVLFMIVYLISWLSWYGFEKRFVDLKQRLAPEKRFRDATA